MISRSHLFELYYMYTGKTVHTPKCTDPANIAGYQLPKIDRIDTFEDVA